MKFFYVQLLVTELLDYASIVILSIACLVFCSSSRLRCTRNKIHINLFLTFILHAVFRECFDSISGLNSPLDSEIVPNCEKSTLHKIIYFCFIYASLTNGAWMLFEGSYICRFIINLFLGRKSKKVAKLADLFMTNRQYGRFESKSGTGSTGR